MLEPRLINANDAIQIAMMNNVDPIQLRCYAAQIIRSTPTADAVFVVRCKDCLHRGRVAYCPMMHLGIHGAVPPYDKNVDLTKDDGFCHRGQKMDGGTENEEE